MTGFGGLVIIAMFQNPDQMWFLAGHCVVFLGETFHSNSVFLLIKMNQHPYWRIKHLNKPLEKLKKGKIKTHANSRSAWSCFGQFGAGELIDRYRQNIGQRESDNMLRSNL